MSGAKVSGQLPKGDSDGLAPITGALVSDPHRLHVVLAIVDCKTVTTNHDTGEVVPTVRLRRIEVVLPGDLPQAEKLIRRAAEQRSGQSVLPLELEDDLRQAFQAIEEESQ